MEVTTAAARGPASGLARRTSGSRAGWAAMSSPRSVGWMAFSGQASTQAPQPVHRLPSTCAFPSTRAIAPTSQACKHAPQPVHTSVSIQTVPLCDTPLPPWPVAVSAASAPPSARVWAMGRTHPMAVPYGIPATGKEGRLFATTRSTLLWRWHAPNVFSSLTSSFLAASP